jgi:hypothetical protein
MVCTGRKKKQKLISRVELSVLPSNYMRGRGKTVPPYQPSTITSSKGTEPRLDYYQPIRGVVFEAQLI